MRYDILKIVFSHTFSMEEAKVAPSGAIPKKVYGRTTNFRMSYLMIYISVAWPDQLRTSHLLTFTSSSYKRWL